MGCLGRVKEVGHNFRGGRCSRRHFQEGSGERLDGRKNGDPRGQGRSKTVLGDRFVLESEQVVAVSWRRILFSEANIDSRTLKILTTSQLAATMSGEKSPRPVKFDSEAISVSPNVVVGKNTRAGI